VTYIECINNLKHRAQCDTDTHTVAQIYVIPSFCHTCVLGDTESTPHAGHVKCTVLSCANVQQTPENLISKQCPFSSIGTVVMSTSVNHARATKIPWS